MRVPLLDLSEQYRALAAPLRAELEEILGSQQFILGPKVSAFEKAICAYCAAPHAIGVSSGTDALLAVFMALGIGPGDAVIAPAYTFFATAGCIARMGATPVFVDIDPATYNISPAAISAYLTSQCRRDAGGHLRNGKGEVVRAIVPVHLFGLCCEMEPILDLARQHAMIVIEDAAQAIGAEYPRADGSSAQAGTMGEAGYFSFYPSKNLGAAGDAGMIVCRDESLANRLRVCRQHGMEERYFHHFVGGNFRLDEIQAAILNVKLPYLDRWSAARRAVADVYRAEFTRRGLTSIQLPAEPYRDSDLTNHHIYHQYVIRTPRRNALREHLTRKEIGSAIYYPLGLHEQECFASLGYHRGDLPETERATHETLALPIYPELSHAAQIYVIDAIEEFFADR